MKEEASPPPEWGWKKTTPPSGPLLAVSALLHCIFGSNCSTLVLGNDNVVDLLNNPAKEQNKAKHKTNGKTTVKECDKSVEQGRPQRVIWAAFDRQVFDNP